VGVRLGGMSTDDQKRASEIHGEALKMARDEVPPHLLERLAKVADGNDRLTAGEIAGFWMANPSSHQGYDLVAAGLLLLAGPVDGDQLLDAVRTGYERGKGSLPGLDPGGG
jgi:hypothetical protein